MPKPLLFSLVLLLSFAARSGAEFRLASSKEYSGLQMNFIPLDLTASVNRGFEDDTAGDGRGGWYDDGPNDLRDFRLRGEVRLLNIPFHIIDPEENEGRTAIVLRGKNNPALPTSASIEVGQKAAGIYFLHTSAWCSGLVGRYRILYEDGSAHVVDIRDGVDIFDWWGSRTSDVARPVWSGANAYTDRLSVYLFAWANPFPERAITRIVAETDGPGSYLMVLAATLTDTGPFLPDYGRVPFGGVRFDPAADSMARDAFSPDGRLHVEFILSSGSPFYRVSFAGKTVIEPSSMGFRFQDAPPLLSGFEITDSTLSSFDGTWRPVWGTAGEIRNNYNELAVKLRERAAPGREMHVVFRVFNDGIGFRYILPASAEAETIAISSEETYFRFSGDHPAWWIPNDYNSYELLFRRTPLSVTRGMNTPVTLEAGDGAHLSVHEADLTDYAEMTLVAVEDEPTTLKAELVPWPDGVKVKGSTPLATPWRTIQIVSNPGELIESHLILNLNDPCVLADTSWIRPMKYMGIWWEMHLGKSSWKRDEHHAATTKNAKRYMDFASAHGIEGLLIEGWNEDWARWGQPGAFSFTTPYPDFDIEEIVRYGATRGVSLISHHETGSDVESYERQLRGAFAYLRRLGIHAVKTGYVGPIIPKGQHHHGQWMVNHYQRVVEVAAEHEVMLDVHEPTKPTGKERTYPNMMTREGVRGTEYEAWSDGNPPEHTTILPFTRCLAGPVDYTPGIFDLTFDRYRAKERVHTTLAKQLALYVVLFSPLQMAADLPENYEGNPAFEFIEKVPVTWDETRVFHAKVGDYVSIGRRRGKDWYLGSITDENARKLTIPLTFLVPGRRYRAQIFEDSPDADWESKPAAITIRETTVTNKDILTVPLAPGGGQAVILTEL